MVSYLKDWMDRNFSDPEAVILLISIAVISLLVIYSGRILAPVFSSIVIAYLLQGVVLKLQDWRVPHVLAVSLVSLLACGVVLVILVWLLPLAWQESVTFVNELPNMLQRLQVFLMQLPDHYGDYITANQVAHLIVSVKKEVAGVGRMVLSSSLSSIPGLIELIVYAILVPFMVFFFLKDSHEILAWLSRFQPRQSRLVHQVRDEVNRQIANYIRGKFLELLIVFVVNAVIFRVVGLHYSIILAFLSGVSVLIPYVGVLIVTIPIVMVAYLQFGVAPTFVYLMIAYGIVMLLDGNILVPLLFSETMSIHPLAIIVAVIFFGGIWGFWGVFFAIPLATVVKAFLDVWPTTKARVQG